MGRWGMKDRHIFIQALVGISFWSCIKSIGIWSEIILDKYMYSDSFVDYIRLKKKNALNASIH